MTSTVVMKPGVATASVVAARSEPMAAAFGTLNRAIVDWLLVGRLEKVHESKRSLRSMKEALRQGEGVHILFACGE
jgi:hypothetical protein